MLMLGIAIAQHLVNYVLLFEQLFRYTWDDLSVIGLPNLELFVRSNQKRNQVVSQLQNRVSVLQNVTRILVSISECIHQPWIVESHRISIARIPEHLQQ